MAGDTFLEQAETQELFRQKSNNNTNMIFSSRGSAGNNPLKLAQILSIFEFNIHLLGWQDTPLASLPKFLVEYQASVNAKYHNDFKEVLIAEEIERKRAERKGISILGK